MNGANVGHSPILRRAVMRAQPGFYSWPHDQQLAYRMAMPDADRFVLERSLFHDLYGVDCASKAKLRQAWDEVPLGELDAINETVLPWWGIGEDCFYLNECLSNAECLRIVTLDAYARDDHAFQESARAEHDADHTARPYQGNLHGRWARLFIDGRFRYATLTSLAGHLCDLIAAQGHELVETLIPHRYVRGPEDGNREGDSFVWDMRRNADGLEPQLDELSSRLFRYESQRWFELLAEFDEQAAGAVYIQEICYEVDEQTHFIFSDKTAMAEVRFQQFLRDCRRLQRPTASLAALEQRESALIEKFMARQHADVMQNFNPKIAELKKRRRVLVHKDAFR